MKKIFGLITILCLSACTSKNVNLATVMITNLQGTSGGTGTIMESTDGLSTILTNAHVCRLAKDVGVVHTEAGTSHMIISYKISEFHDLCLAAVAANLKVESDIALKNPSLYDNITISGHPHLLPTIITKGNIAGDKEIQVLVEVKECTQKDLEDPVNAVFCTLFGKLPIVKAYNSTVVSAIIQPGSSGSAVYNDRGHIIEVVFAGQGDLGYGFTVPYPYVYNFMSREIHSLPLQFPTGKVDLVSVEQSKRDFVKNVQAVCNQSDLDTKAQVVCGYLQEAIRNSDLIY